MHRRDLKCGFIDCAVRWTTRWRANSDSLAVVPLMSGLTDSHPELATLRELYHWSTHRDHVEQCVVRCEERIRAATHLCYVSLV